MIVGLYMDDNSKGGKNENKAIATSEKDTKNIHNTLDDDFIKKHIKFVKIK